MRRHIAYTAKLILPEMEEVEVRITKQTHVDREFTPKRDSIFVHNGFVLRASAYPYHIPYVKDLVYVRGWDRDKDDDAIRLPLNVYNKFKAAVVAYNEEYKN